MAAPRSTSVRALRLLSQQHQSTPCLRRNLHITGSHSAPPSKVSDRGTLYASHSLADLKNECQRRSLRAGGSKSELIERLSNNDVLQTRAFSIAMRRINSNAFTEQSTRTFNTSRSSKTVNDNSPVDFIYMPSMHEIESPQPQFGPRIPVLPEVPSAFSANNRVPASASTAGIKAGADIGEGEADSSASAASTSAPLLKPQVYTVSGGSGSEVSASPMSEVVDNHSVEIDPFSLTETVGRSRFGEELERERNGRNGGGGRRKAGERGVVGELWNGFLDDLWGRSSSGQGQGQKKGW